ncbi:unnamed protein product [Cochlearia groenlandica]
MEEDLCRSFWFDDGGRDLIRSCEPERKEKVIRYVTTEKEGVDWEIYRTPPRREDRCSSSYEVLSSPWWLFVHQSFELSRLRSLGDPPTISAI